MDGHEDMEMEMEMKDENHDFGAMKLMVVMLRGMRSSHVSLWTR